MKFKNLTCLKKVWEHQAETKMIDTEIIFNESFVKIEGSNIVADIKDREFLFLVSSSKTRKEESIGKKPEYDIIINRVECYTAEVLEKEIPQDITGLVMITKSVYTALKEQFSTNEAIYEEILKVGISQISTNLVDVKDFCAVTCNIVDCD